MGIANRTPDSFFDHGSYYAFDRFLAHVEALVADGADIIDIGGVKAGSGPEVSVSEELERVVPAVEAVVARFDVAVSVDTWRSEVLEAVLEAGAHIGNDISGFADPRYVEVAARWHAAVVATHIRLRPRVDDPDPRYEDLVGTVRSFLAERVRWALNAGLEPNQVVVDAGFDLGKTTEQSLALLAATGALVELGHPVLIAASNKGFVGETLGLGVTERREASLAAAAIGFLRGGRIFRMHDVRGARRALDTLAALVAAEGS
jgi:dihydropteroate synthase